MSVAHKIPIITKSSVVCYKIRYKNSTDWADITLDYQEKSGRLSIASNFGDWGYYWGACGCNFKEFLMSLNMHYVAGKFGCDRYFDLDATIKQCKIDIITERRFGNLSFKTARIMWDELQELISIDSTSFIHEMFHTDKLSRFYTGGSPIIHTINPAFKIFWEGLWKDFIAILAEEIKLEIHA